MNYTSPLLTDLPFESYTFEQISAYFNENTSARLSFFLDFNSDEKTAKNSTIVYQPNDYNNKFDQGDQFLYFLSVFVSKDASLLAALYPKLKPLKNEIIFLLEDNTDDLFSNAVYYSKIGTQVHNSLKEDGDFLSAEIILRKAKSLNVDNDQLPKEKLEKIFKYIKENGSGKFKEEPSIYDYLKMFFPVNNPISVSSIRKIINDGIIDFLDDTMTDIDNAKYKTHNWKFQTSDKKVKLPFFPNYSIYRNVLKNEISAGIQKNISSVTKEMKSYNDSFAAMTAVIAINPAVYAAAAPTIFQLTLTSQIIFNHVETSLESLAMDTAKFLFDISDAGYIFANAFLCGFYNSLLATIEGLLFIVKIPFWLMKVALYTYLPDSEKLDETIQTVTNFDYNKATIHLLGLFSKVYFKIYQLNISDLIANIGVAHVGYFTGSLVELVIEAIIGALTFGTYTVTSLVNKFGKVFKTLIQSIFKIVRKFFKIAKNITVDVATLILKVLSKGADEFGKLIDDIWKVIEDWMARLAGFTKSFDKTYQLLYTRPTGLYKKLTKRQVSKKYGHKGRKLYDVVEKEWNYQRKILLSGNARRKKVLVSGMIDKKTGKISKVFSNFTRKELRDGKNIDFIKKLHPTLRKRLDEHIIRAGKNGEGLNLKNPDDYKFAWKALDNAHAEFRALDDLLKKIDPKGKLGDNVVKRIIGYNSYLKKPGIQYTCADCFYLTDGVIFIK